MKYSYPILFALLWGCQKEAPVTSAAKANARPEAMDLSPAAEKNARIEVVAARMISLDQSIEAPGKLAWNEDKTVSVGVIATGKITNVYARVGDLVKENQVLARMHTHDVHDTKAALRQARAEKDRALSALEQYKRTEDRMRRLLELKSVSPAQVEQAQIDRKTAETMVRKADAEVDKEVQHLTETLEITADDEDSAGHKHNEEEELVPIKASAAGTIVDRKVTPGSVVTIGQDAFTISESNSLWVIANFPESSLGQLRIGLPVEVDVRAYPARHFPARIARLGETLDADTRTLLVRAEIGAQGVLKPEMPATIRLRSKSAAALVVPESALQTVDGKATVFVETAAGKFLPRTVEAQVSNGQAIIVSGLKEGERVAANGSYFLKGQMLRESGN